MAMTLAIIQARLGSHRLPNKMLLPVGGKPVIRWAWEDACAVFGAEHVVVAVPAYTQETFSLPRTIRDFGGRVFAYDGEENDVLGRFHACAHAYRHDPSDVIARITPDDFPIDPLRERFTLGWLDEMHATVTDPELREHIGHLLPGRTEINTPEDYEFVASYYTEQPQVSPFDGGPWSPC